MFWIQSTHLMKVKNIVNNIIFGILWSKTYIMKNIHHNFVPHFEHFVGFVFFSLFYFLKANSKFNPQQEIRTKTSQRNQASTRLAGKTHFEHFVEHS